MVFTKYLHEGIAFLLRFNKYVVEPKGFIIYVNKSIAQALSSNFEHEQYPFESMYQLFFAHGVYRITS